MRILSAIVAVFLPFLSYGMGFDEVCAMAYRASGALIQNQGIKDANLHAKASALAGEPLSLEADASHVRGLDPINSGLRYRTMLNVQLKKPQWAKIQAEQYDQEAKHLQQQRQQYENEIRITFKHDWLIAMVEEERIKILEEKATFFDQAYRIGEKKVAAGRLSQMELMRLYNEMTMAHQELDLAKMEREHLQHTFQEATMAPQEVVIDDLSFAFIVDQGKSEGLIQKAFSVQMLTAEIDALALRIQGASYEGNQFLSVGIGMTHEPVQESVDIRVAIPLVLSSKNEQQRSALMAQRSALIHEREVLMGKLRIIVPTLLEHLKLNEERLTRAVTMQTTQKKLREMGQKGYEGGVIAQFEYLASQNSYYEQQLRTLELKRTYIDEMRGLEEKLGRIWE